MDASDTRTPPVEHAPSLGTPGRVAFVGFALVAGYFLWTEHRAHVIQFLPWALLLLCPLMHVFMHRGHASHRGSGPGGEPSGPGA